MAITVSGLYTTTFKAALNNTLALDLELDTHKLALFHTLTPNFATDTAYGVAPYNANEASGGSWAAGGYTLLGTTPTSPRRRARSSTTPPMFRR